MFNLFQKQISSIQLIKILEHNSKKNKAGCWSYWVYLIEKDFPGIHIPTAMVNENLSEKENNERFTDHYENFYRTQEIRHYKSLVPHVIPWLRRAANVMTPDEKFLFDEFCSPNGRLALTPDTLSSIRHSYAEILGRYAAITGDTPMDAVSPLAFAIYQGNRIVIDELLKAGADITTPNCCNTPPIYFALDRNILNVDIIFLVLEEMSKKNALTRMYLKGTVLDTIIRKGNLDIMFAIKERFSYFDFNAHESLLKTAVIENNAGMTRFLLNELKERPDILVDRVKHLIVLHLHLRSLKVEKEGYIGRHGYNPADMALLSELFDTGVNVNIRLDDEKRTPLMFAAWKNDTPAVAFMLSRGADANLENDVYAKAKEFTSNHDIIDMLENAENDVIPPTAKKIKRS